MARSKFKERCEVRLAALDMNQEELCEIVGRNRARLTEALRGETSPSASNMRISVDQTLTRLVGEKRKRMAEELRRAAETQAPHLEGELSLLLPEDMLYIVLEDGIPVGLWSPDSKSIKAFPPTLGM